MPLPAQVRLHVPTQGVGAVLARELVHTMQVGEDFTVDPLPEGALMAAAGALHARDPHLGGAGGRLVGLPSRLLARSQRSAEGSYHALFRGLVGRAETLPDLRRAPGDRSVP